MQASVTVLGELGQGRKPKKRRTRRAPARPATPPQPRPNEDYVRKGDIVKVAVNIRAEITNTAYKEQALTNRLNNAGLSVKSMDASGIVQFGYSAADLFVDVQVNDSDHANKNDVALSVAGAAEAVGYYINRNSNSPRASFVYQIPDGNAAPRVPRQLQDRYAPQNPLAQTPPGTGGNSYSLFSNPNALVPNVPDVGIWQSIKDTLGIGTTGAALALGAVVFVVVAVNSKK